MEIGPYLGGSLNFRPRHDAFMPTPPGGNTSSNFSPPQWVTRVGTPPSTCMGKSTTVVPFPVESLAVVTNSSIAHHNNNSHNVPLNFLGSLSRSSLSSVPISKSATTSVWGSGNRTSPPASVVMPCTRTTRYASSSAARAHSCNQTRTVAPRVVAWRPDDFLSSNSVYRTTDTCCTPSSGMLSVASPFAGPSLRFNGFMNPHRDAGYRCEAASHRSFSPNVAYQNDLTMGYSAMTPSPLERSFVPPPSWDGMEPSMSSDTARTACCHGSGSPGSSFVVSRFMSRLGDMVQRTGSSSDCYSRPRKINRLNTTSRAGQSATHHFEVNSIRGDAQGSLESRACRNSTGFGVGERPKSQETTTTEVERQRSQFAGSNNNSNTNDACSSGPPNRGVIPYPRFRASNTARLDNNVQKCLISLNSHDGTAGMTSSEPVSQVHNINTSHNSPMTGQSPNSQECMSTQTTAATSTLTATNNTAHNISDEVSTPNCDNNNIIITSPKHKVHNKQTRTKSPGSTTNDHPLTSVEQDDIENELQLDVIESFMRSPLDSSQQLNSAKRSTTWPATSLAVLQDNNLQGNEVVSSNNNNLRVRKPSGYADPKSEIDGDQSNIMSAVSPSFDSTALGDEHETSIDEASPSFTSKDPVLLPDGGTPQAKGETDSACQRRGRVLVKDLDNGLAKALLKNTLFTDSKASSPASSVAEQQTPSAQADIRKMLTVNSNVANECLENTLHIRNYLSNLVPPAAIRFVISRELNVWPSKWPLIRNVSIMSQKKSSSCTGNNNAGNVSRGLEETIKAVMELDCHKLMKQVATNNGRDMISSAMKHIVESMHSTPVSPGVKNRRMTSSPSGEVLPITELRKPLTTSRANENDQPKINKRKSAETARCNGTTNISGNWDDLTMPTVVRNCTAANGKTFGRDQAPPRESVDDSLPKGTLVKESVTPHTPTSEAESVLLGQCNAKPTTSFGANDEYSMAQTPSTKASNNDQHQSSLVLPLPTSSADHLGEESYRQPTSEVTETVTSPSEVDSQFMASKSPKSSISKEEVFLPPSPQFFMPARNANYTGATIIRHVHGGFRLSLDMPPSMMIPKSDLVIGEPISKGTFGTVYKGMWKGREVAIKVSHIDTSSASVAMSLEHLKNFEREVNAYLKLKHEHVVTCYGISVEPPCFLAIVMEFVKSGNVFDLFFENKHYIGAAKRLSMAKQLVSAVCYLHGNKPTVVHRDLKTPNLILDQDLNLKLCDFGKTKFMNGPFLLLEDNGGSPRYMAPECFASNGLISEKADIWSLACCLIEIFGGPIPYEEYYDNARVIQRILTYGLPPLVPNWFMKPLQQILHAAFSFDPSLRPNALEIQAVVNSIKPRDMELRNMHRRRVN